MINEFIKLHRTDNDSAMNQTIGNIISILRQESEGNLQAEIFKLKAQLETAEMAQEEKQTMQSVVDKAIDLVTATTRSIDPPDNNTEEGNDGVKPKKLEL